MAKKLFLAAIVSVLCTAGLCTPSSVREQRGYWEARYQRLLRDTPKNAYRVVKKGYYGDNWELLVTRDVVVAGTPCQKGAVVRLYDGELAQGCANSKSAEPGCVPQTCKPVGLCDAVVLRNRWIWNGFGCLKIHDSGCGVQGPDCDKLYRSLTACRKSHRACSEGLPMREAPTNVSLMRVTFDAPGHEPCPTEQAFLKAFAARTPRDRKKMRLSWHYAPWCRGSLAFGGSERRFALFLGGLVELDTPLPDGNDTFVIPVK